MMRIIFFAVILERPSHRLALVTQRYSGPFAAWADDIGHTIHFSIILYWSPVVLSDRACRVQCAPQAGSGAGSSPGML